MFKITFLVTFTWICTETEIVLYSNYRKTSITGTVFEKVSLLSWNYGFVVISLTLSTSNLVISINLITIINGAKISFCHSWKHLY